MEITFRLAVETDMQWLMNAYRSAIDYQQSVSKVYWLQPTHEEIAEMIEMGKIWIISLSGQDIASFVLLNEDHAIWGDLEKGDSIYLHRIVTMIRGKLKIMPLLIEWALSQARQKGKKYLRMDTWTDNQPLIDYYRSFGFALLGHQRAAQPELLPSYYTAIELALLQLPVPQNY